MTFWRFFGVRPGPENPPIGADGRLPTRDIQRPHSVGVRLPAVAVRETSHWRRGVVVVPVLIGALAFGLRIWQPGPVTVTGDEPFWLVRADAFRTALANGDLAQATAAHQIPQLANATMPGVTTMWAANAGRGLVDLGADLGVNAPVHGPSANAATVLRAGRGVVALWCAVLIGVTVALGRVLLGRIAGTVAGVVLATEPWFVGLGDIVHTDELLTLFSAVSILSLAWALEPPRRPADAPHARAQVRPAAWRLAISGACAGLAVLTKISALALVIPGVVIVVLIKSVPDLHLATGHRRTLPPGQLRSWTRMALWWTASALIAFIALWPALWVAPLAQVHDMIHSAGIARYGHNQFFLGSTTRTPGVTYYPVVWAFRMTPWVLVGALGALIVCVVQLVRWCARAWRRDRSSEAHRTPTGPIPSWLVMATLPYALIISLAPTKFDRYVIPLLPFLALAIGVVVAAGARAVERRFASDGSRRTVGIAVGIGATIAISALTLLKAPYAVSYTNPMLGGQKVARHVMLLGWGEGRAALGADVARREAGNCDRTTVARFGIGTDIAIPCGRTESLGIWLRHPRRGDYFITNIRQVQRKTVGKVFSGVGRPVALVDQVDIGGVPYARLWQVR